MTLDQINQTILTPEYDFLRTDPRLGKHIMLLGLGGSHSYGTQVETSDLDVRGVSLRPAKDILLGHDHETVTDAATDTAIYTFDKILTLLASCNPNTIELLGLKKEHYLYTTDAARYMIDNADMFLSKKAVHSFGGYAQQQLRRMWTKSIRETSQEQHEQYILSTIQHASHVFPEKYALMPEDALKLFIDKSMQEGFDSEIYLDINLHHYPLRDWVDMWSEMQNIVRSYNKLGMRNSKAIEHGKLGKHQMHLARLYLMAFDILMDGKIVTYREKDHDFLMDIRNGKYLDENNQPLPEFIQMVDEWEAKLKYCAEHSPLPDTPDWERINRFKAEVNYSVVTKGLPFDEQIWK